MKKYKPNYGPLILILIGLIVVGKIVESVGKGGLLIIAIFAIWFVYSRSTKNNQPNDISRKLNYLNSHNNEDDNYKYLITRVKEEDGMYIYFQVDIPKNKQNINVIVHDLGLHEDGWNVSLNGTDINDAQIHLYNIKTKKWKDSYSPFYSRTPSVFINFIINKWKEVNGDIPESRKKNIIYNVDISTSEVKLEKFEYQKLSGYETVNVKGSQNNVYSVSISTLTCSCPDFKKRRASFELGDVRRLCKHLAKQIVIKKLNTSVIRNKMNQAFIRKASSTYSGVPIFTKMIFIKINEPVKGVGEFYLLINDSNKNWVNVIWFTERTYAQYRYNVSEKRWAHSENPFPDGHKTKYNLAIQNAHAKYIN